MLAAAGIRQAILVGHSDGASIALIFAGSAPVPGLRGLILEAPHVFTEPHGLASIAKIGEAYRATDLRERLARHHGANVDVAFRGWNDVWLDPAIPRPGTSRNSSPRSAPRSSSSRGRTTSTAPGARSEAIARQSGGPVEALALPACGHSPHRERPDLALPAMARFVRAL